MNLWLKAGKLPSALFAIKYSRIKLDLIKKSICLICCGVVITILFNAFLPFSVCAQTQSESTQDAKTVSNSLQAPYPPAFSVQEGEKLIGFWLESFQNRDFPSQPKLTAKAMEVQAVEIVSEATKMGYNSVFYTVTPECAAMYKSKYLPASRFLSGIQGGISFGDPLKTLIDAADKYNMDVYAILSPFNVGAADGTADTILQTVQNRNLTISMKGNTYYNIYNPRVQEQTVNLTRELVSRYGLSGIALDLTAKNDFEKNKTYYDCMENILSLCEDEVKRQGNGIPFGVVLDGALSTDPLGSSFVSRLAEQDTVNFFMPRMPFSVLGENTYDKILKQWYSYTAETSVGLVTVNEAGRLLSPSTDGVFFGDMQELNYQQFVNMQNDVRGSVAESWYNLHNSAYPLALDIGSTRYVNEDLVNSLTFTLPSGIAVTSPTNAIRTDLSSYYVTGVCNPEKELSVNGKKVLDISDEGFFGILLPLSDGTNQFNFEQDGVLRTVSIMKNASSSDAEKKPLTTIDAQSAFPSQNDAAFSKDKLILSCIAPSGGIVTAQFADTFCDLIQTDPLIEPGLPAEFTANLDLTSYPSQVVNLGSITYSLVYNNKSTVQPSLGTLTIVGPDQKLAIEITDAYAPIYDDPLQKKLLYTLPSATQDYVSENKGEFFLLQSGGYIKKDTVKILTDPLDLHSVTKEIKNVVIQTIPDGEYITFAGCGGVPNSAQYDPEARALTVTLSNISQMPENLKHLKSELFSGIEVRKKDKELDVAIIILTLKEGKELFGFHIDFNENNTILYCKDILFERKNPEQAASVDGVAADETVVSSLPLSGMNVVIDPGQGGNEKRYGAAGRYGPSEAELNLAVSLAISNRLEAYGASVYLTRKTNSPVSTVDRVMSATYHDADLFLSIHHSLTPADKNAAAESGITVSYNQPLVQEMAQSMSDSLAGRLIRKNNSLVPDSPLISQISMTPALQIDLGYISNPYFYGRLSSPLEMYRSACVIAQNVLELAYID